MVRLEKGEKVWTEYFDDDAMVHWRFWLSVGGNPWFGEDRWHDKAVHKASNVVVKLVLPHCFFEYVEFGKSSLGRFFVGAANLDCDVFVVACIMGQPDCGETTPA